MKTLRNLIGIGILATALMACGDDNDSTDKGGGGGGTMDQQATATSYAAANAVISQVTSQVFTEMGDSKGDSTGSWITQDGNNFTIKGEVTCAAGGKATVVGTGSEGSFSLTISFAACKDSEQDITLDGSVTTTMNYDSEKNTLTSKTTGDLSVTGSVQGTLSMDYTLTIEITEKGMKMCTSGKVNGQDVPQAGCIDQSFTGV